MTRNEMEVKHEMEVKLAMMLVDARRVYETNGRPQYDAGVCEGIKRAIEEVRR